MRINCSMTKMVSASTSLEFPDSFVSRQRSTHRIAGSDERIRCVCSISAAIASIDVAFVRTNNHH
jgi:hypothetical protein